MYCKRTQKYVTSARQLIFGGHVCIILCSCAFSFEFTRNNLISKAKGKGLRLRPRRALQAPRSESSLPPESLLFLCL